MCVYICVHVYMHVCVCVYAMPCPCLCTCLYVCTFVCICMCVSVCVHMCVFAYTCDLIWWPEVKIGIFHLPLFCWSRSLTETWLSPADPTGWPVSSVICLYLSTCHLYGSWRSELKSSRCIARAVPSEPSAQPSVATLGRHFKLSLPPMRQWR